MSSVLNPVLDLLSRGIDLLLLPLQAASPIWGLVTFSALAGVIFIIIYGRTSNQRAIRAAKRRIGGAVLEVWLFRHDIGVCLRAQGEMLRGGMRYFLLALRPLLFILLPGVILFSEANARYGYRSLHPAESAIVRVQVGGAPIGSVRLETVAEATPPVRIGATGEIFWRVRPRNADEADFRVITRSGELSGRLAIDSGAGSVVGANYSRHWYRALLSPPRGNILTLPFDEVSIRYPEMSFAVGSYLSGWMTIFLLVSFASALLWAKAFRIEV